MKTLKVESCSILSDPQKRLNNPHRSNRGNYTVAWIDQISAVDHGTWNTLAIPLKTPFLEWEWLYLMELSGSAKPETGWSPMHLTVWRGSNLVAAAPLYIKTHSEGEFVYDYPWADVSIDLGISYYPKLVGMSPFTPLTGYRFLFAPDENEDILTALMTSEIERFCRQNNISGCNFLYVDPQWGRRIINFGFSVWLHSCFLWQNQDVKTFDDFLLQFNTNQRRNIRRECKSIIDAGLSLKIVRGNDIPNAFFPLMYKFYSRTCDHYGEWACRYLKEEFFHNLNIFKHRIMFVAACMPDQDEPVGMSMCIQKGDRLYGRYWGSSQHIEFLHFNVCYYTPIEWAISNKIRYYDPGAGGDHKPRRGFVSVPGYSLHRFYDKRLQNIMKSNILRINQLEQAQIQAINNELPLRKK